MVPAAADVGRANAYRFTCWSALKDNSIKEALEISCSCWCCMLFYSLPTSALGTCTATPGPSQLALCFWLTSKAHVRLSG